MLLELLEADAAKFGPIEEADIKLQKESFPKFVESRSAHFRDKNWRIERQERFEKLKQKKLELVQKEELLYIFEK